MTMPLFDGLEKYKKSGMSSFHTPGHKCNFKPINNLLDLDFTELPSTDSLFDANSIILEAENNARDLFGSKMTLFSAGGCTLCIQTMIKLCYDALGKERPHIICSRNSHKSVINTLSLLDITPVWIYSDKFNENFLTGGVEPSVILDALKTHKDVCAVYITSPDYYGVMSDIRSISNICKEFNVPLIVDNAHGTHLRFLSEDVHPISLGATMSADSAHKTLPVLTGGAFLHINDEKYMCDAKLSMSLFASTSPSYPIMTSLDIAREWAEVHGKAAFSNLEKKVSYIKEVANKKGIVTPFGSVDPTRITLKTSAVGITGTQTAAHLREHGVEAEYFDSLFVVLIPTPFNTDRDFKRLEFAISQLDAKERLPEIPILSANPKMMLTPAQVLRKKTERISICKAKGRVVSEIIAPCPPGVPLLIPGEYIGDDEIKMLYSAGIQFLCVVE